MPAAPPQSASKTGCTDAVTASASEASHQVVVKHLGVLDPVTALDDQVQPDHRGGALEALDDRAQGGVADGMEARLETGPGARDDVVGDRVEVDVQGALRLGVGVRCRHARGVRAERTVDEEVTGRTERPELPGARDATVGQPPQ